MRRIILNLAMSLDGYIADENGGYDWIVGDEDKSSNINEPYDFDKFLEGIDALVVGRKAYEDCPFESFKEKTIYIMTSNPKEDHDNIKYIKGDVIDWIENLRKEEGKDIYLFGGGGSIDPFIKADLIDEYCVAIVPTILGRGRKLFYDNNPEIKLRVKHISAENGMTILTYIKR